MNDDPRPADDRDDDTDGLAVPPRTVTSGGEIAPESSDDVDRSRELADAVEDSAGDGPPDDCHGA